MYVANFLSLFAPNADVFTLGFCEVVPSLLFGGGMVDGYYLLKLNENSRKGLLELLLCFLHVFLMGSFLVHQATDVAVGRLDHGVEVVGTATVHLSSLNPGEQGLHSF